MAQGAKAVRGSGPWGKFTVTGSEPWAETAGSTLDGIRFRAASLPLCANPADVELVQAHSFNELILCARDLVREGRETVARLQQPYGAVAASLPWGCGIDPQGEFVVRNAYEFLRAPGLILFQPGDAYPLLLQPGEDMARAEVIAPVSEGLIRIAGRSTSDRVREPGIPPGLTFAVRRLAADGAGGLAGLRGRPEPRALRPVPRRWEPSPRRLQLPRPPLATVDLRNCEGHRPRGEPLRAPGHGLRRQP